MPSIIHNVTMKRQIGTRGIGLLVDLNCGWYCHVAAINYHIADSPFEQNLKGRDMVKRKRLGKGYHPHYQGSELSKERNKPYDCADWERTLRNVGPIMATGKLGAADWGVLGGVGHIILIVGADAGQDWLYYKDPLQGNKLKNGTFAHLNSRMDMKVDYVDRTDAVEFSQFAFDD